ncbi:MAG: hypothetical protein AB8F78_01920 [Saprospiraceae bacterium]
MSTTATYYQKSGKTNPLAYVYALLLIVVVAPILAGIYTLAIWHIPFVYLNFLLAIGFGFVLGLLTAMVVKRMGKVRSGTVGFVLSLLIGLSALYIHWGMWSDLVLNVSANGSGMFNLGETFNMLLQPGALFSFIGEINSIGTWGLSDTTVSGTFLSVVWLIEAALIAGGTVLFSGGQSDEPFCEISQEWFKSKTLAKFTAFDSPSALKTSLESGDMSPLEELGAQDEAASLNHSVLTLYANATNENYLSVSNMISKMKDDEITYDEQILIRNLKISEETSNMLEAKIGAPPSA